MENSKIVFYFVFAIVVVARARGFSVSNTVEQDKRAADKFSPTPNLGKAIEGTDVNDFFFIQFPRFLRLTVNQNFFQKCEPCPKGIKCVPTIQCPAHVRMKGPSKPQICDLPHGGHGFCCTTGSRFAAPSMNRWIVAKMCIKHNLVFQFFSPLFHRRQKIEKRDSKRPHCHRNEFGSDELCCGSGPCSIFVVVASWSENRYCWQQSARIHAQFGFPVSSNVEFPSGRDH